MGRSLTPYTPVGKRGKSPGKTSKHELGDLPEDAIRA